MMTVMGDQGGARSASTLTERTGEARSTARHDGGVVSFLVSYIQVHRRSSACTAGH
jgi:hypothetical protein